MPKGRKKKSSLSEFNRSLELLTQLVKIASPLFEKARPEELVAPSPASPTPKFSPYELFGLPKTASEEKFKQRYRELMRIFHSDLGSGSDVMAKRINQAWDQIKREKGWK